MDWLDAKPAWLRWGIVIIACFTLSVVFGALLDWLEPFDAIAALLDYYDLPRPPPPEEDPTFGPPRLRWGY